MRPPSAFGRFTGSFGWAKTFPEGRLHGGAPSAEGNHALVHPARSTANKAVMCCLLGGEGGEGGGAR